MFIRAVVSPVARSLAFALALAVLLSGPFTRLEAQTAEYSNAPQTPWQSNENGVLTVNHPWAKTAGYHFKPLADGYVTRLGGYFKGIKRIRLWNKNTGELLALADVESENAWNDVAIDPVAVQAGTKYTVAAYFDGSGGSKRKNIAILPRTYGDVRILGSTVVAGDNRPTNTLINRMLGQVDVEFVLEVGSPPQLFTDLPQGTALSAADQAQLSKIQARATTLETRLVQLTALDALLGAQPVAIELFGGEEVSLSSAALDGGAVSELANLFYSGETAAGDAEVVLLIRGGGVSGSIRTANGLCRVRMLSPGVHVLIRFDLSALPPDGDPVGSGSPLKLAEEVGRGELATKSSSATIDVLFLYTDGVAEDATDIIAEIAQAVHDANVSYDRSDVSLSLRSLQEIEVDYDAASHEGTQDHLEDLDDGMLDEVAQWRDFYGADVVVMVIEAAEACGLARDIPASSNEAFATVYWECVNDIFVPAHEIGHLIGARHHNDPGTYPCPYGHGYVHPQNLWRTIMAQRQGNNTFLQNWSNPDVLYPAGTGDPTGTAAFNDSARCLDERGPVTGGFLDPMGGNNRSHRVRGVTSCMGTFLNCQILHHEFVTLSGPVRIEGGGISGSPTHKGYRCGNSSNFDEFIEVYVNDSAHDWPWPTYCLRDGDTLDLESGNTYDFRTPSVQGATPLPFELVSAVVLATPGNLIADAVGSSRIDLDWTDNSEGEDGTKIERRLTGGSWSEVATVGEDVTSYSDSGLAPDTTYHYRVRAFRGSQHSGYSNIETETTDPFPFDVTATPYFGVPYQVGLQATWTAFPGAADYEVTHYRRDACGEAATVDVTGGTSSGSGLHTNCCAPGTCYLKRVTVEARDAQGTVLAEGSAEFCEVGPPPPSVLGLQLTPYFEPGYAVGVQGCWNPLAGAADYRVTHYRRDACDQASVVTTTAGSCSSSGAHENCGVPDQCYLKRVTVEARAADGTVIGSESACLCEVGSP